MEKKYGHRTKAEHHFLGALAGLAGNLLGSLFNRKDGGMIPHMKGQHGMKEAAEKLTRGAKTSAGRATALYSHGHQVKGHKGRSKR